MFGPTVSPQMLQSGRAELDVSFRSANLPRPSMAGASSVDGSDEQIFGADEQVSGRGKATNEARGPTCPHAFLGSNETTYGLREGGAGFHRNRPTAGKARPTLSAGIVRRVQNADGVR